MARNSRATTPIWPEFELIRDFMPVLVSSKFDEDLIKMNEPASRHHFLIISLWECFRRSREWECSDLAELIPDFMSVLVTCQFEEALIKTTEKRWRHRFPNYISMGTFCCHGNQSFDTICALTLCKVKRYARNRNWYNQIPYPALKTKREITKYITWQQFTKGMRGKPNEQLSSFPDKWSFSYLNLTKICHSHNRWTKVWMRTVRTSNNKEPQQTYRLGTVSIKILAGLNPVLWDPNITLRFCCASIQMSYNTHNTQL